MKDATSISFKRLLILLIPTVLLTAYVAWYNLQSPGRARSADQVMSNLRIIVSEGERLSRLINDVLDIAKMEAGKMEWKLGLTSMAEVVQRSVDATSGLFEGRERVRLVVDVADDLPPVSADAERLIQVVINLVSNAAKFTQAGTIEVWAERIHDLAPYQINQELMNIAGPKAVFMHCLPAYHDHKTAVGKEMGERFGRDAMEVTDEVFEGPQSIVFDEAENRMHTIKAVMAATLGYQK